MILESRKGSESFSTGTKRIKNEYFNKYWCKVMRIRPTLNVVPCRNILLWHGSGTTSEVDINFNAVLQLWHGKPAVPVFASMALARHWSKHRATAVPNHIEFRSSMFCCQKQCFFGLPILLLRSFPLARRLNRTGVSASCQKSASTARR